VHFSTIALPDPNQFMGAWNSQWNRVYWTNVEMRTSTSIKPFKVILLFTLTNL